jgi:hypothetical protein
MAFGKWERSFSSELFKRFEGAEKVLIMALQKMYLQRV